MGENEPVPDHQKQVPDILALLERRKGAWVLRRQARNFLDTSDGGVSSAIFRLRKQHPEVEVETKRRVGFRIKPPEE